jgi:transcription-repair coupling factor (superfamily II helicase)
VDPNKHVTPNAARRLKSVEEFSDLGAGFALAMRDLEIRGAGNILGTQQSGHIALVGYELYCQLLEEAVRRLQRLPPRTTIEVDIDLPGEAYIPRSYVPGMREKIDLYRRLTRVSDDEELRDFVVELEDRFGPLPAEARRLVALAELRIAAYRWQVRSIRLEDRYAVLGYASQPLMRQLAQQSGGRLRVADEQSAYLALEQGVRTPDQILNRVKLLLQAR